MQKTIIKLGIVFIGIVLFQNSYSQKNYLPGYVINEMGDTILGYIDYRNWERNPHEVGFKQKIENESTYYLPTEITEFGVLDEIYVSGIVNAEISPRDTREFQYNSDPILKNDTAFLQTLIRGNKSLYFYKDFFGYDNYYIQQDSSFVLLIHKKYLQNHEDKIIITENKYYLSQLFEYLNECQSIFSTLQNTVLF